jgi:hypothetical protein
MAFIPGYPITVGAFFVCLGIFYTFQSGREANDIIYSVLLPIAKKQIVTARYLFVVFIQLVAFLLMMVFTLIRMTVLKDAQPYLTNPLQNANLFYLVYNLLIFAVFNLVFVNGFFKTGYYFAKPFIAYIVLSMLIIVAVEILHYLPGLQFLSETGFVHKKEQLMALCAGIVLYLLLTLVACKLSQKKFEKIDL